MVKLLHLIGDKMKRKKIYVGCNAQKWEVFRSAIVPVDSTHGNKYLYAIGPFRTIRAANYMAKYGRGNPNLQTVGKAERCAVKESKKN